MKVFAIAMAALCLSGAASAAPPPEGAQLTVILECKSQADERVRLRCYDDAVAALQRATANGSIIVVDREDVRKTRRSLFGFSLPKLPFFGGDDSQQDQPDIIEAQIVSARGVGYGKWVIVLEGGARWQTTEASSGLTDPKPGLMVTIKKAALGGYFLKVGKGRAVRAMRVG